MKSAFALWPRMEGGKVWSRVPASGEVRAGEGVFLSYNLPLWCWSVLPSVLVADEGGDSSVPPALFISERYVCSCLLIRTEPAVGRGGGGRPFLKVPRGRELLEFLEIWEYPEPVLFGLIGMLGNCVPDSSCGLPGPRLCFMISGVGPTLELLLHTWCRLVLE